MKEFKNIKGSFDYLPEKQIIREDIKKTMQEVFGKYGYSPVETPILCYLDLLASKYSEGADILNEIYKLKDQGKRSLGMRYDLTLPFAKLISMNKELKLPLKRYEIGKVFRDGPVKLGRNREFTQCDVDVVGVSSLMPESEFMAMSMEIYEKLGLDIEIQYNNRKLLSGILDELGVSKNLAPLAIMLIDKFEKLTEKELFEEFQKFGVGRELFNILFGIFKLSFKDIQRKFSGTTNPLILQGIDELTQLTEYTIALGVSGSMRFTPFLARGIGVYTGTVWEIFLKDRSITSSIGAGGRYDNIITTFIDKGKDYPAVGMTFGLDVIYEAIQLKNQSSIKTTCEVYIIPMGTQLESLKLAKRLRAQGIKTDIEMNYIRLKKSLDYANKSGIPYVIILGENEIASGIFSLKNMKTGEIKEYYLDEDIFLIK